MSRLYLVVQHHDVARVSVEPHVDGLAHAADLVQRRCVEVWPAELHNLRVGGQKERGSLSTQRDKPLLGGAALQAADAST